MSTHDIQALLSDNEESDEDKEQNDTIEKLNYYHHESGPFSKNDGSYRHRHNLSPSHLPLKNPKLRHSWSTPDFSLYSQPSKKTLPTPKFKSLQPHEYREILQSIVRADIPILPKSFILCPVQPQTFQPKLNSIYSNTLHFKIHTKTK